MDQSKMRKIAFLIAIMAIGFGITVAGFSDIKCIISGKTVNVSQSLKKDFRDPALAEGEVFFIQGPFATYEQTKTTFGIPTGKTSTNYYLVLDMTRDEFLELVNEKNDDLIYGRFYFIYATSDKEKMDEADKAAKICADYYKKAVRTGDYSDVPDIHFEISGKLMKQPTDSEYKRIRDNFLSTGDMKASEIAELMVRDGKPGISSILDFAIGILLIIAPVVILIVLFIKKKKEESASEIW